MRSDLYDENGMRPRKGYYLCGNNLWYAFLNRKEEWILERLDGVQYPIVPNHTSIPGSLPLQDFRQISLAEIDERLRDARKEASFVRRHTSASKIEKAVKIVKKEGQRQSRN